MAANLYESMMSAEGMDEEKLRMLAEQLRGGSATGGRLSTSSLEPIQNQGRLMQTQANQQAQQIGLMQSRKMASDQKAASDEARNKAMSGLTGFSKVSNSAAEKFEDKAANFGKVQSLINRWDDDFRSSVPFGGDIQNWAGSHGVGTDTSKAQAEWWGDWKKYYENIERHELFGSALTAPEQRQWKASNITPDMTPDQIKSRLRTQSALNQKIAAYSANNALNKKWDPTYVKGVMDIILPEEAYGDLKGYMDVQTDIVEEPIMGGDEPDLNSMSLEELRALRAAMGQ